MTPAATAAPTDRAAAVRSALRALVAERGFHGASMGAVAREAGVATGTAYVHYASKDDLVIAAYLESKDRLGAAVAAEVDPAAAPPDRFVSLWTGSYRHFAVNPSEARFLLQVDASPYAERAHAAGMARVDDPLVKAAATPDLAALLLPLPLDALYELGIAPAVRLAARGTKLTDEQTTLAAEACWRAISRPT